MVTLLPLSIPESFIEVGPAISESIFRDHTEKCRRRVDQILDALARVPRANARRERTLTIWQQNKRKTEKGKQHFGEDDKFREVER